MPFDDNGAVSFLQLLGQQMAESRKAQSSASTIDPYLGDASGPNQPGPQGGLLARLLGLVGGSAPVAQPGPAMQQPPASGLSGMVGAQAQPTADTAPPPSGLGQMVQPAFRPSLPPHSFDAATPVASPPPSSAPAFSPAPSGPLPTFAAQGAPNSASLHGMFGGVEKRFGLPSGYLAQTMAIEDPSGDPNATSPTGAKGRFQFTSGTAKQYGLTDPSNIFASAMATGKLAADNAAVLAKALGRPPTAGELYLAHQQGAGAAAALLSNPNAPAGQVLASIGVSPRNITVNGGDPSMPAGAFAAKWTSRFGAGGTIGGDQAPTQVAGSPFGGLDPSAFGGGQPAMVASGMGGQPSPATSFPGSGYSGARSAAGQPVITDAAGNALDRNGQPTSLAYAGALPVSSAPAQRAIGAAVPSQPYGTVPLSIKGRMMTRQQAEDAPESLDVDGSDYDAASAKAGLVAPPSAVAPATGSGQRQTGALASAAPLVQSISPGGDAAAAPTPRGAFSQISPDMIRALLANPDTNQLGLELWKTMVSTKAQPIIYHRGDVVADASGRPLFAIPDKPEITDAIKNYQFAQGQGYGGTFQSYQADQQKADKAQLSDVPLPNGQFQKVWMTPGQGPAQGVPVGAPYTKTPPNQVTINQKAESATEQEYGKAVGSDIASTVQAAGGAPQALAQINIMRSALASGGDNITTGPFATYVLKGKQALGGLLGTTLDGVPEAEVINNIGQQLATQGARAISSRPTQFEFAQQLATKPGLSLSKPGIAALLSVKEQDIRDQQALAQLATDPANRQNWTQVKAAYYASHPVMSPFDPSKPFGQADINALDAASARSGASSLPPKASLRDGQVYQTPRGAARWNARSQSFTTVAP